MEKKKTTIKCNLSKFNNFLCTIQIETEYYSGRPLEFQIQHDSLVDKIARLIADNHCAIRDISIV